MKSRLFGALLGALVLSACAGERCLKEQPYAHARSVPVLQPVDGLKVPESSSALRIPPPPAEPEPFGRKVRNAKGKQVVECLDEPPRMTAPAPPLPASPPGSKPSG